MTTKEASHAGEKAKKHKATQPTGKRGTPAPTGNKDERGVIADRRARIIALATKRIAKNGFEATTVRQIANDANILSGSLYHHFETKEEILREVVKDASAVLRNESLRIANSDADPETKLVALVLFELGEQVQNHQPHAILYNERKLFRRNEEFADVRAAKRAVYEAWLSVLEAGMKSGQFDRALDLYQTIRTIIRMLNSAADWYASGEETTAGIVQQYSFEEVRAFYLRFILGAVRDPRRASDPVPRESAERLATTSGTP